MKNRGDEKGVVLVWMSVAMTALLSVSALAIDVGFARGKSEQAQRAADAAALAGSLYLSQPNGQAVATKVATNVAVDNGFVASQVKVTFPEGGRKIQVAVSQQTQGFFGTFSNGGGYKAGAVGLASYAPPSEMGSPSNVYGNEPTQDAFLGPLFPTAATRSCTNTPTACPLPSFWASIAGPGTRKDAGDPYGSQNCGLNSTAVWSCPEPSLSDEHYYSFTIKKTTTAAANVELFDPAFSIQSNDGNCAAPRSTPSGTGSAVGDDRFVAPGVLNDKCTSDASLTGWGLVHRRDTIPNVPGGNQLPACGQQEVIINESMESQIPVAPPESFSSDQSKVKKIDYKGAPPLELVTRFGTNACSPQDFPITSYSLYDTDQKTLLCGPVTWDPAPAEDVYEYNSNNKRAFHMQYPDIVTEGTDGTSLNIERHRNYEALANFEVGYNDNGTPMPAAKYEDVFKSAAVPTVRLAGEPDGGYQVGRPDLVGAGKPYATAAASPYTALWAYTRQRFNQAYRRWVKMPCQLPAGKTGNFMLVARTDQYVDNLRTNKTDTNAVAYSQHASRKAGYHHDADLDASPLELRSWKRGYGTNKFSIRAYSGTGIDYTANKAISVSADTRQGLYTNLGSGTNSYLTRVPPSAGKRTLELSMFDLGDNIEGLYSLRIYGAGTNGLAVARGLSGCTATLQGGSTSPPVSITGYVTSTACTLFLHPSATRSKLLTIKVNVPSSYSCAVAAQYDCWIMGGIVKEGTVSDTTTWSARLVGNPSRLSS